MHNIFKDNGIDYAIFKNGLNKFTENQMARIDKQWNKNLSKYEKKYILNVFCRFGHTSKKWMTFS